MSGPIKTSLLKMIVSFKLVQVLMRVLSITKYVFQ